MQIGSKKSLELPVSSYEYDPLNIKTSLETRHSRLVAFLFQKQLFLRKFVIQLCCQQ
jgi:hypothetical protein